MRDWTVQELGVIQASETMSIGAIPARSVAIGDRAAGHKSVCISLRAGGLGRNSKAVFGRNAGSTGTRKERRVARNAGSAERTLGGSGGGDGAGTLSFLNPFDGGLVVLSFLLSLQLSMMLAVTIILLLLLLFGSGGAIHPRALSDHNALPS